jgi:cytochrome c oxidase assembly protein subunit 15
MEARASLAAHRLAVATAAATLLLLVAGALVTSTGSGDAVPDWWFVPLSFGSLLPEMTGGVLFEHGHRLVAASVGLLTIALALSLRRAGPRLRRLGVVAVVGVVVQGILGGMRVLHVFPPAAAAIVHATLAQGFFVLTVALALLTARRRPLRPHPADPGLERLSLATTAAIFATAVFGAVFRHTREVLALHLLGAGAVTLLAALSATRAMRAPRTSLSRSAVALVVFLGLQVALGFGSFLTVAAQAPRALDAPLVGLAVVTAHLAVGGLLLATSFALTFHARAGIDTRDEAAPLAAAVS